MRRKDREITDPAEMEAVIAEAAVCRIGLADETGPYIVPLCFGYGDRALWIHSAHEGRKIDMLRKDSRCCFGIDICDGIIRGGSPCSWGMRYRSVIGFGRAVFVHTPEEKQYGLNCIMQHYGGGTRAFSERDLRTVTVIRIDIESMTGKKHD
ncbi:MAG: Pyridoxamine 5'-phosphate oxidase [Methanoregula sp. PtaU1.Bin006]|uniref:pyridoxamine 5'-phosphate oxidase family protein n=1 Tax=Methanoregula sp. PtaU1.Bin006 TaxID=1811681 RepID=UPI0009CA8A6E|nr:pyridoxamine 5'-phosphate oxidase family protein [Methanoregula sp. PtaU1.Bin006]OPY33431.1 MAG: Pyridoxamine 5'-phosphate oxidase [Methanoregula sp. PtaU1.Bin006]